MPLHDELADDSTRRFYGTDGASWASLDLLDEPPYPVEQAGSRRLFDEVGQAHRWWLDHDQPKVGGRQVARRVASRRSALAQALVEYGSIQRTVLPRGIWRTRRIGGTA